MTREELLAQLAKLLPAQFEEVLFRAKLPQEYLPASSTPQATRAIEVIRYLEQQDRLPELARVIEYVVIRQGSTATGPQAGTATHPPRARAPLVVAAATGAAALGLLAVMLSSAQMLVRAGMTDYVWYVLLSLLGLFAAVTVFSLFKSYARYRGNALGGTLELGVPVVVMLVVVVLGFYLVPAPAQHFDVTVFLHGNAGRQAMVLRNRGKLALDLGADKRIEAVGDKGEVRFAGIPGDMRNREVALGLDDETYELVKPELTVGLNQEAVYAAIQPKQLLLVGYVAGEHGRGLPQARAVIAKAATVTDQDGRFEIKLPADLPEGDHAITIIAAGYEPWRGQAVPGGDPLRVQLLPSSDGK
jgi:hypothetical protein